MVYAVIAILTVALHIHLICTQTVDVRCTEQFCEEQIAQNPCQEIPEDCSYSSGTLNGIMMLEPSTCNCCDYCIPYLGKGADCVPDGQGQPLHQAVCGPSLWCSNENATCVPLHSACTKEQSVYDEAFQNGTLGFTQVRTLCDGEGDYLSPHCILNSICYCVNPDGERIFGEKVFSSSSVQKTMTCECSLAAWKAEKLAKEMGIYSQSVHCLEDGSYDPLQCDENNLCSCLQMGSNIPGSDRVPEIDIKDNLPKCFDPNIHQVGKYARKCEAEALKIKLTIENLLSEGIIPVGLRIPVCQYDGRYSRLMVNNTHKFCVDPDGNSLGYEVERSDLLSDGMDCNCARTSFLLERAGWTELPTCCDNGNFRAMQCYRGSCYCVDCNGNQQGKEKDEAEKDNLNCGVPNEGCCVNRN